MLNGIAPIIVFHLPFDPAGDIYKSIQGIPNRTVSDIISQVGIPIPIYLSEGLTGIYVDNESKAIDVDTDVKQSQDPDVPDKVIQKGTNSLVSINMLARKDSIILGVLLALSDLVFQRVSKGNYGISYFNGPTALFNGKLHGFSSTVGNDDNLFRVVLQIQKINTKSAPENQIAQVSKQTALTPSPGLLP